MASGTTKLTAEESHGQGQGQADPSAGGEEPQEEGGLKKLHARAAGAHSATETSAETLEKAHRLQAAKSAAPTGPSSPPTTESQPPTQGKTQNEGKRQPQGQGGQEFVPPPPPHDAGAPWPVRPRDFITPPFRHLLSTTTLGAIVPQLGTIVIARSTESIAAVLNKLIEAKILSVPLLNVETNQYVAFLDLLDLLAVLVESLGLNDRSNWPLIERWLVQVQLQGPCIHLAHRSARNQWFVIAAEQPLDVAIQQMAKYNVHRLAVSDLQNNFVSVLTQSRLVYWLTSHLQDFPAIGFGPLAELTLADLKLGFRPVISIGEQELALDAFLLIHKQGVSAVAVLDEHSRLSGALSISDLKARFSSFPFRATDRLTGANLQDIGSSASTFTKLFLSVGQFMRNKAEGANHLWAYYVTKDDTVRTVMEMMTKYHVHRVFVVNNIVQRRLVGVVSTNDILELFDTLPTEKVD